MKIISLFLAGLISLTTTLALADSTVTVTPNKAEGNRLDVMIHGEAAQTISAQLSHNGVQMRRDPFSGATVQEGQGVKCIDGDRNVDGLYCYIAIIGASVK